MSDCIFCKIAAGELPVPKVYDDGAVLAFPDIKPQAPTHLLIIPHQHIPTLNDVQAADAALVGNMHLAAQRIAHEQGFAADGYRLITNCNRAAGQEVFHIHIHLLAGRRMGWPPG